MLASLDFTERAHLINAQRGMGATKIAARMIQRHTWNSPAKREEALRQLAILGGRTIASLEASKEPRHRLRCIAQLGERVCKIAGE